VPDTTAGPHRGRPADPEIEARVLATTLELYREVGWARLNLDLVARRASVGKAALYRRWPTKEQLITAALAARIPPPDVFDTGSLRGDLLAVAHLTLQQALDGSGLIDIRLSLEEKIYPEMFGETLARIGREQIQSARNIVLRAIDRGELPAGTSPAMVLDAVAGTIKHHYLMTPVDRRDALRADSTSYVERVVDFVLTAAGHRNPLKNPAE
jgi:AcrR family transcriptional regulator